MAQWLRALAALEDNLGLVLSIHMAVPRNLMPSSGTACKWYTYKHALLELNITAAKETEVGGGRKTIIIFVPVPRLKSFQKIQVQLVRELEKKFSGKHVVFIAQRRILPKPTRKSRTKNKQKRPRSRMVTTVHDAILEDLVFPSEIVGKRIRVKLDGSRLIKVH
ncbi:hypothetical protein U0070_024287 [Myodes glareolus]|uniref:40S ribosomal protein S7 n=1 Tax=Myodes glareolus TaxID=447135 RepID=A0AAW0I8K4_MYOGA